MIGDVTQAIFYAVSSRSGLTTMFGKGLLEQASQIETDQTHSLKIGHVRNMSPIHDDLSSEMAIQTPNGRIDFTKPNTIITLIPGNQFEAYVLRRVGML